MAKTNATGRQVLIEFSTDNGVTTFPVAEITNFSWKADDIVKESRPLGHNDLTIDVLNNGGTLSFEANKSDSGMINLFAQLQKHFRAGVHNATRGRSPYFLIRQQVKYTDGTIETLIFKKVVLHSPEQSASGADEFITNKFEGRFDEYIPSNPEIGDAGILNASGKAVLNAGLVSIAQLGEQTAVSYL